MRTGIPAPTLVLRLSRARNCNPDVTALRRDEPELQGCECHMALIPWPYAATCIQRSVGATRNARSP